MENNHKYSRTSIVRKMVVDMTHEEVCKVIRAGSFSERERLEYSSNPYEAVTTVKTVTVESTKFFVPREKPVDTDS